MTEITNVMNIKPTSEICHGGPVLHLGQWVHELQLGAPAADRLLPQPDIGPRTSPRHYGRIVIDVFRTG